MKYRNRHFWASLLTSAIFFFLINPPFVWSKTGNRLPRKISVGTFGVGTTAHALVSGLGFAVEKKAGIKMIPIPRETETGRFLAAKVQQSELVCTSSMSVSGPLAGITEFSSSSWGPQPIQLIWRGPAFSGWVATADSGIKKPSDIRGKRVPYWTGTSSRICTDLLLEYANLTWKDVKKVEFPSWFSHIRAAKAGNIDVFWGTLTAGYMREIAGKPNGMRAISFPPKDKESWKRLKNVAPFISPRYHKGLPGEEKEIWSTAYSFSLYTYPWLSEDLAYTITKSIAEGYDFYHAKHPSLSLFTLDFALDLKSMPIGYPPYHPGAVKYFKEINRWTQAHEKWQAQSRLLIQERKNAWIAARKEAKIKKIKINSKTWPMFWEEYQVKYLSDRGFPSAPAKSKWD